jgi:hypothetical protein
MCKTKVIKEDEEKIKILLSFKCCNKSILNNFKIWDSFKKFKHKNESKKLNITYW